MAAWGDLYAFVDCFPCVSRSHVNLQKRINLFPNLYFSGERFQLPIAVSPDGLLLCIVTAKRSLALYRLAPPASSSSSSPSSSSLFSSSPSQLHSANGNSASIEEGKISGNPIPSCTGAATASCGEGIRVLDFAAEEVEGEAPPVEVEITALKVRREGGRNGFGEG